MPWGHPSLFCTLEKASKFLRKTVDKAKKRHYNAFNPEKERSGMRLASKNSMMAMMMRMMSMGMAMRAQISGTPCFTAV